MIALRIDSIDSLEKQAQVPWSQRTSVISIGDTNALLPNLIYIPDHFLHLEFDDITLYELKEEYALSDDIMRSEVSLAEFLQDRNITIFSNKQAKQIADFVLKYKDVTDLLICQCVYGQSRSAGCAAAIMEYFFHQGIKIFADERYCPNKLVYRRVLCALKSATIASGDMNQ